MPVAAPCPHPVTRLQEEEDVYDKICDTWVQSRNATLEQQVTHALRPSIFHCQSP
jgi:hypothetical protein